MQDLLTPKEAAKKLKISEGTLRHWACKGIIPKVKLRKCLRFREEDIQKFIEDNIHLISQN